MSEALSIWTRRLHVEKARSEFQEAAMHDYNRDVFYPAMKALRAECSEVGHKPQAKWHVNGIGWSWRYCSQCADRLDITGPTQ